MSLNSHTLPKHSDPLSFRAGFIACLPTVPGYLSIGFAAGAIGTLAGFSVLQTALLATLLYTGSAQFLFYSLWAAGAEMTSVVLSVMLVNLRYLLMSSAISVFFRGQSGWQKVVSGLLLTDETFGVAVQHGSQHGKIAFSWMFGLNLPAWLNWIVACVIGAYAASAVPESLMAGLSFSLVSMFIGLILMTWFASRRKWLETLEIVVAVLVTYFSAGHLDLSVVVIIAASIAASLATLLLRMKYTEGK